MSVFDARKASQALAEGMATMMQAIEPLNETVLGYRRQLEQQGWSPAQAEVTAGELHVQLIRFLFNNATAAKVDKK